MIPATKRTNTTTAFMAKARKSLVPALSWPRGIAGDRIAGGRQSKSLFGFFCGKPVEGLKLLLQRFKSPLETR